MKSLPFALCIGVLSLTQLISAQNSSLRQKTKATKSDAQISFSALKSLAGRWSGSVTTDPPNPDIEGHPSHHARGFQRERPGAWWGADHDLC
jgi:hypothetical protein